MDSFEQKLVLVCEDSAEGILSAVYEAYHRRLSVQSTFIETKGADSSLFAEYESIEAHPDKVKAVLKTLRKEFREEDVLWLDYALAAEDMQKGQAVYRTIAQGRYRYHSGQPCGLFDDLKNPYVHKTFSLARGTLNELHHLKGFLRFEEMENGILFAGIGPKSNILSFLSIHFADRFPMENFVICDRPRNLFAIHPAGKAWYLLQENKLSGMPEQWAQCERERDYQELFRHFCHKIAIEERRNEKLQTGMLPLRFRKYMTEFEKS